MSNTERPAQRSRLPEGAEQVDIESLYGRLAKHGLEYGPAFRGLRAVWSHGDEVYADAALDDTAGSSDDYLLHPALFDAALQAALVSDLGSDEGTFLPFVLRGVRVHKPGARAVRVHTAPAGGGVTLALTGDDGEPVATVGTVLRRSVTPGQLDAAAQRPRLLRPVWKAVPPPPASPGRQRWAFLGTDHVGFTGALKSIGHAFDSYPSLPSLDSALTGGTPAPDVVAVSCTDADSPVRSAAQRALMLVQEWLGDERLNATRLVLLTSGAVATRPQEDLPDVPGAAVWGLLRSAQSEHPGRFVLVDIDNPEESGRALAAAVASGEPQLAVRRGTLHRPRLVRRAPPRRAALAGTVLVTGGTGALGRLVARHLVTQHEVTHLVLLSRRGPQALGATELNDELTALGARVDIIACDATDRAALERALGTIPAPSAVIHTAGLVSDATAVTLTPRRLDEVLGPKVDAALHLHDLIQDPDCAFVLFSSIAGLTGNRGQGNYAAANAALDALAHRRRTLGLRGTSLAWGLWEDGMGSGLSPTELGRIKKSGFAPLTPDQGLALFDAALAGDEALLAPVRLNESALSTDVPPILADLVSAPSGTGTGESLRSRLAALPEGERDQAALDFVLATAADVLGFAGPEEVAADREFSTVGLDSLGNLELSRRLSSATGIRLPATLAFDYPTPADLASQLRQLLRENEK
ncbi:type I polyketide synthase [Streptomyces johnsoniae]